MAADSERTAKRRLPPVVVAGALVLLAWCAWRVLSLGLADRYAADDPQTALAWRDDHPEALLAAAEAAIDPAQARTLARKALRSHPLPGRGFRILAALERDPARAAPLYAVAAERSPRDVRSLAWLLDHAVSEGDYAVAIRHLDQLLRVRPALAPRLRPVLEGFAAVPEARAQLAVKLDASPPWRSAALRILARDASDPNAVTALFDALRRQPNGLDAAERRAWLQRLIGERQWGAAYLAWASQLPPEQQAIGNVFNGGFEWLPTNAGFDWRFERTAGVRIERASTEGVNGASALRLTFEGRRAPFRHVRQLMALPPSVYRLEGRVRLERLRSERGLVWTLSCVDDGRRLADTEALFGDRPWQPFGVDFEVPASGCGGQWLTLRVPARTAAERRIGGVAWFDDLRVTRRDAAPPDAIAAAGAEACGMPICTKAKE